MSNVSFSDRISPELRVYAVSIDSVKQHPDNSRKHRLDKIMESLTAHGQRALIVVQKSTGFIVKGNGTWAAAKQLGWTRIAVSTQEMTDEEALGFLIADNRASDLATYEADKHLAALEKAVAISAQGTLFSMDDIADLEEQLKPLAVMPERSTDAARADELAGEEGAAKQAQREAKDASDGEKLKDVRFPLTLLDYEAFAERMKMLQRRYGTPGVIATFMEAIRRQAEAEGGDGLKTGRQLDAAAEAAVVKAFAEDVRAMLYALPGENVSKAQVIRLLNVEAIAPTVPADPPAPADVPGQEALDLPDGPVMPADLVMPQTRDWSQSSSAIPVTPSAMSPETDDER